jgi:hypothetical protein
MKTPIVDGAALVHVHLQAKRLLSTFCSENIPERKNAGYRCSSNLANSCRLSLVLFVLLSSRRFVFPVPLLHLVCN